MAVVGDVDRWAHNAEPAGEPAVIAVRDLRMRYGSVDVLKGIGFTARRGEVITLLGPNGAGKTTTIESIFVPSLLLIPELTGIGLTGWLTFLWVLALGLLATLPIGAVIGSLAKSPNTVNGLVTLPIIGVTAISGIFYPIFALPGWVQAVAQVFPVYWLGLGVRSAFLPDSAAAVEIGASWRHLETVGVLGAWALVGLALAPMVLRRMARKESGANMEARRQRALQRIG